MAEVLRLSHSLPLSRPLYTHDPRLYTPLPVWDRLVQHGYPFSFFDTFLYLLDLRIAWRVVVLVALELLAALAGVPSSMCYSPQLANILQAQLCNALHTAPLFSEHLLELAQKLGIGELLVNAHPLVVSSLVDDREPQPLQRRWAGGGVALRAFVLCLRIHRWRRGGVYRRKDSPHVSNQLRRRLCYLKSVRKVTLSLVEVGIIQYYGLREMLPLGYYCRGSWAVTRRHEPIKLLGRSCVHSAGIKKSCIDRRHR